jgi:trk system potassium uptake protein TrkA
MPLCAVVGLGQLGSSVATTLAHARAEVIAIDRNLERVEAIQDRVARALCLDITSERAVRAAGVGEADAVVLALGEGQLEEAVLATMILRDLGVGEILSRAATDVQGRVLERVGVTRVLFPERQMGQQIARQILVPAVREMIPLSAGNAVAEVEIRALLAGQTIGDAGIRAAFGVNVVAVHHRHESARDDGTLTTAWDIESSPGPATKIHLGDVLVVVGADARISEFANRVGPHDA